MRNWDLVADAALRSHTLTAFSVIQRGRIPITRTLVD